MEAEAFVLHLFDSIWFHLQILQTQPKTSIPPTPQPSSQKKVSRSQIMSFHKRSKSHELPTASLTIQDSSPLKPHLQTIPSDKEMLKPEPLKIHVSHIDRRKKRLSKSLSELEFEEVKGFLDLGFVFSEEDKEDSSLVEIIPGLQKLGKKTDSSDQENINKSMRGRPYLSEAWEVSEYREKEDKTLMQWRVPAVRNEMDMKISLKSWAHTVASAVR